VVDAASSNEMLYFHSEPSGVAVMVADAVSAMARLLKR
jgi:hypothetical protein